MLPQDFIMMPIPADSYTAVCALLGGAASAVPSGKSPDGGNVSQDTAKSSATAETLAPESLASDGTGETVTSGASPSDAGEGPTFLEIDAHGHPWQEHMHASTKGKTKDGLWRMKVGVSRPDPLPGFPREDASADTGTSSETDTNSATSQGASEAASAPAATVESDEDEFAAFRAAAATSEATDAAAAASVPARQFSDADLGALCNQAAVKLGDPSPVKEIIARFVPEGQVAHSRNIPAERREEFAKEVEAKAGIQFAG